MVAGQNGLKIRQASISWGPVSRLSRSLIPTFEVVGRWPVYQTASGPIENWRRWRVRPRSGNQSLQDRCAARYCRRRPLTEETFEPTAYFMLASQPKRTTETQRTSLADCDTVLTIDRNGYGFAILSRSCDPIAIGVLR